MSFHTDMKMASISIELSALRDGYELIKSTLKQLQFSEKDKLEKALSRDQNLEEDELIDLHQELYHKVDIFYPRLFWGPYLISIFSVFESCTEELTEYIRENTGCKLKLDDLNGSLLEKLKLYYASVLNINYFIDNPAWKNLTDLCKVRNCFAHSNGRFSILKPNKHEKVILKLVKQNIGISEFSGVVVINSDFVSGCLESVFKVINDLKALYINMNDDRLRVINLSK